MNAITPPQDPKTNDDATQIAETNLMVSSSAGAGGNFLAKKSATTKARQSHPQLTNILVVEDEKPDSDRLVATLNLMFSYDLNITVAATLSSALDAAIKQKPDLIFLDDVLKPSDNASDTIPYLRHAGYDGPIIVISSKATRKRKAELLKAGAIEVIHKDDVDSVAVSKALEHMVASSPATDAPTGSGTDSGNG